MNWPEAFAAVGCAWAFVVGLCAVIKGGGDE
jgi:hypothetical protein